MPQTIDPDSILALLSAKALDKADGQVAVPVATIADTFGCEATDPILDAAIKSLVDDGLICRWFGGSLAGGEIDDDESPEPTTDADIVTLTPLSASRIGVRLNDATTRWIPIKAKRKNIKVRASATTVLETDLSERPPGVLASYPDYRMSAEEAVCEDERNESRKPYDHSAQRVEERKLGLVRPTLPLTGCRPWPVPGQSTAPFGPSHLGTAHGPHGKPSGVVGMIGPCRQCESRPLRALISLVPTSVGKNRAAQPPQIVDGGEYCCACNAHWQDPIWPVVTAKKAEPKQRKGA